MSPECSGIIYVWTSKHCSATTRRLLPTSVSSATLQHCDVCHDHSGFWRQGLRQLVPQCQGRAGERLHWRGLNAAQHLHALSEVRLQAVHGMFSYVVAVRCCLLLFAAVSYGTHTIVDTHSTRIVLVHRETGAWCLIQSGQSSQELSVNK